MDPTTRVLVFDPFSGASGDMIIGSLLSLGADKKIVKDAMESAADVAVTISEETRSHITATRVIVTQKNRSQMKYNAVVDQILSAGLLPDVTGDALGIMELMGRSEAHVHGTTLDDLHLHEMGQQDAIADIVGAAVAFHDLRLTGTQLFCLPISTGGGFVETSHGLLPVPAPATLEILNSSGLIWRGGPVEHELLTPTGAAILAYLTAKYGKANSLYPLLTSTRTGYGAGSRDFDLPNVLRTVTGELDPGLPSDHIEMLETNVDNVTGEVLGHLMNVLMDDGARDVSIIPATMKKGRSGHLIKVICESKDSGRLARKLMVETGSLGIRVIPVSHRLTARRVMKDVQIQLSGKSYQVQVKIACDSRGDILDISAEFDDCRRISLETGLPVREVIRLAEEKARQHLGAK